MAVSDSFLAFVVEQLEGLRGGVITKRMFGGVGMYCGDVFFAIIDNDTLFFKVDGESVGKYRDAGMPPFAPIPGKPPMMSYYQVPISVLEDRDEMRSWAGESIARAQRTKSPKGPRVQRTKGSKIRRRR